MNSIETVLFGHNLLRIFHVTVSARCSLTLLISFRIKYKLPRKIIIWILGNMCILYELVSGVDFTKI